MSFFLKAVCVQDTNSSISRGVSKGVAVGTSASILPSDSIQLKITASPRNFHNFQLVISLNAVLSLEHHRQLAIAQNGLLSVHGDERDSPVPYVPGVNRHKYCDTPAISSCSSCLNSRT